MELTFDYGVGCDPVIGTTAGTLGSADESGLTVQSAVVLNNVSVEGSAILSGTMEDGVITITTAGRTVLNTEASIEGSVVLNNLVAEALAEGNLTPSSSSAEVTIIGGADAGSVVVVTYTADSPDSEIVLASVNGGPTCEFLLD